MRWVTGHYHNTTHRLVDQLEMVQRQTGSEVGYRSLPQYSSKASRPALDGPEIDRKGGLQVATTIQLTG